MKKITMSIGVIAITTALALSYSKPSHSDSIKMSRWEVSEMINTIEDILEWQHQDMEEGETSHGSHEEGWGSNYWLTEIKDELFDKLRNDEVNCENCDEID